MIWLICVCFVYRVTVCVFANYNNNKKMSFLLSVHFTINFSLIN